MPLTQYPIMEHFPTLQGEGYHSGRSAYFIRLAGCDVGCVWCDVKESWPLESGQKYTVDQLINIVGVNDFVVLTGGEPAMYDLSSLTSVLMEKGKYIALETSGCYTLKGKVDWYTFSPKKFKDPVPEAYKLANELKIVIYHPSDLEWAKGHAEKINPDCVCYLQPEWGKKDKLQAQIIEFIHRNPRWKLSLQTHKYLNIP